MKFMILMSAANEAWQKLSPAEQERVMERHGEFRRALEAEGKYVTSHRLAPSGQARTVTRSADGRVEVIDGPFAESKEVVGGFYIIEAASLDEAVEWAKRSRFMTGWNEVRPLAEG
ncbi:MAG: YciI family protein [Myxococcota bacterium]